MFFVWLGLVSWPQLLVPGPGIESMPLAEEAQSVNHWTAREVPAQCYFIQNKLLSAELKVFLKSIVKVFLNPHNT